jgi:hypothetical protein
MLKFFCGSLGKTGLFSGQAPKGALRKNIRLRKNRFKRRASHVLLQIRFKRPKKILKKPWPAKKKTGRPLAATKTLALQRFKGESSVPEKAGAASCERRFSKILPPGKKNLKFANCNGMSRTTDHYVIFRL